MRAIAILGLLLAFEVGAGAGPAKADATAKALRDAVDDGDRAAIVHRAVDGAVPDSATFDLTLSGGKRARTSQVTLTPIAAPRERGAKRLRWYAISIDQTELDNVYTVVAGIDRRGRIVVLRAAGYTVY